MHNSCLHERSGCQARVTASQAGGDTAGPAHRTPAAVQPLQTVLVHVGDFRAAAHDSRNAHALSAGRSQAGQPPALHGGLRRPPAALLAAVSACWGPLNWAAAALDPAVLKNL